MIKGPIVCILTRSREFEFNEKYFYLCYTDHYKDFKTIRQRILFFCVPFI
jgi:hypothetical protein